MRTRHVERMKRVKMNLRNVRANEKTSVHVLDESQFSSDLLL